MVIKKKLPHILESPIFFLWVFDVISIYIQYSFRLALFRNFTFQTLHVNSNLVLIITQEKKSYRCYETSL